MGNTRLLFLFSLAVISTVAVPQKKDCNRPKAFKNAELLAEYIGCIKSLTGEQRYGKRSYLPNSRLIEKLQSGPHTYQDYDNSRTDDDLQNILFDIFKIEDAQ